jgi:hypothetical protein
MDNSGVGRAQRASADPALAYYCIMLRHVIASSTAQMFQGLTVVIDILTDDAVRGMQVKLVATRSLC